MPRLCGKVKVALNDGVYLHHVIIPHIKFKTQPYLLPSPTNHFRGKLSKYGDYRHNFHEKVTTRYINKTNETNIKLSFYGLTYSR
jgi:hypothetical protein